MTEMLPIFPLSLVVFPGENLNLHIFEERYKELVNDTLNKHSTFGIPAYINGKLCELGTEVEILTVDRVYAAGEMDIKTRGLRIFRMDEVMTPIEGKLYSSARIDWVEPVNNGDESLHMDIVDLLRELHGILRINKEELNNPEELDTYKMAHFVGFSLEQEYDFLSLKAERDRQLLMLQHLRKILPVAEETERLKKRVKANGHFKNIIPPEF